MKRNPERKKTSGAPVDLERKLRSQLNSLRTVFDLAVTEVLLNHRALDRVLSAHWRENRQFGSRDRRLFSESIFAYFRFYGWLKKLLTPEEIAAVENGRAAELSPRSAGMLLLGAWSLENLPPEPAHNLLARHLELKALPTAAADVNDSQWRQKRLVELAGNWLGKTLDLPQYSELLSPWALPGLVKFPDMESYFASMAVRPPLWLRSQVADVDSVIAELAAAGLTVKRHPRLERALAVTAGGVNLYTLEAYRAGRIEVQDLASQVIAAVCAPRRGERWWDCCAGAGGKTLALAELMERTGKVVAGDIRAYKLDDLKKRARRAGFPNIEPRPWDGKKVPPRKSSSFDGILVDAPCSCAGVWRRNPDGRWSTPEDEPAKMAQIQRTVLENVLSALRPGGVLVYATCSVFEAENQAVVKAFLADHPEFELEDFADPLTGESTGGMLAIAGYTEDSDSMFAARFRKVRA